MQLHYRTFLPEQMTEIVYKRNIDKNAIIIHNSTDLSTSFESRNKVEPNRTYFVGSNDNVTAQKLAWYANRVNDYDSSEWWWEFSRSRVIAATGLMFVSLLFGVVGFVVADTSCFIVAAALALASIAAMQPRLWLKTRKFKRLLRSGAILEVPDEVVYYLFCCYVKESHSNPYAVVLDMRPLAEIKVVITLFWRTRLKELDPNVKGEYFRTLNLTFYRWLIEYRMGSVGVASHILEREALEEHYARWAKDQLSILG